MELGAGLTRRVPILPLHERQGGGAANHAVRRRESEEKAAAKATQAKPSGRTPSASTICSHIATGDTRSAASALAAAV